MYSAVLSLTPRLWCSSTSAVYVDESSTNTTRECFFILFADAMKQNLKGFEDEDCQVIPRYYLEEGSLNDYYKVSTESSEII